MKIELTGEEAKAILDNMKAMTVKSILLSAVMKLNGTPLHEPGMGMPFAGGSCAPEEWVMTENKINLIKAWRALTQSSLVDAKNLVEKLDPNGRGFIRFSPEKYKIETGFKSARELLSYVQLDRV